MERCSRGQGQQVWNEQSLTCGLMPYYVAEERIIIITHQSCLEKCTEQDASQQRHHEESTVFPIWVEFNFKAILFLEAGNINEHFSCSYFWTIKLDIYMSIYTMNDYEQQHSTFHTPHLFFVLFFSKGEGQGEWAGGGVFSMCAKMFIKYG